MPATLERTVTIDRSLARRADRKLRRYGHSFDEAVNVVLTSLYQRAGIRLTLLGWRCQGHGFSRRSEKPK